MNEELILTGTVEDIIYQNSGNDYAVFTIESADEEIVCVGTVPQIHAGENLKLMGSYVMHSTYGKQFQVQMFEKNIPTTEDGIEKYLASGVIKGIGPKTAKKIVSKFGEATFYVIEEKPDRLVEVKGITYDKAMKIHEVFVEQNELRTAMIFLQDYGISAAYAMKIYKKYKDRTMDIVKTNPYRLADDIFGIGFKMADKLAASAGIEMDSPFRIKSGIKFVLNQGIMSGHIYLPRDVLIDKTVELLEIDKSYMENAIIELQMEHQIWQEDVNGVQAVYLNAYYYAEMAVAKRLLELAETKEKFDQGEINKKIDALERKTGVILAKNQRDAVSEAMSSGVLVITGGPGTGKTTTINTIISLQKSEEYEVLLAAPTGRAAKRMSEATGFEAQTIHRLLGISFVDEDGRQQVCDKNEENPIEADVIIIDEMSMVDIMLMNSLLKAIISGTRLILVGDVDQLPSVGAGNVLKDIIKSEKINVVRLHEIFRQAQESSIIMNAHRINKGEEPVMNERGKDFFFVKRPYIEDIPLSIVELVTKRLPKFIGCDTISDIQVLTPMRKSHIGVYNLNKVLQEHLNPPSSRKNEKDFRTVIFREGDKVMQIKNNYNLPWRIYAESGKHIVEDGLGVFNGDQGTVFKIDNKEEKMTVEFDDRKKVEYDFTQLEELELAYAITIHKSQGSEYSVVVIPIHSGPPMLMSRNLLYTAVTRAKNLVVLVGLQSTVNRMVENNREINRYSSLSYRIKTLYDFIYNEEESS